MPLDPTLDNPTDALSRRQWAAAVAIMMCSFPLYVLEAYVVGGEKKFLTIAGYHLQGHAFHNSDITFIFRAIENTVKERKVLDPLKIWDAAQSS